MRLPVQISVTRRRSEDFSKRFRRRKVSRACAQKVACIGAWLNANDGSTFVLLTRTTDRSLPAARSAQDSNSQELKTVHCSSVTAGAVISLRSRSLAKCPVVPASRPDGRIVVPVRPTPTLSRRGPPRAGLPSGAPAAATNARRGGSECGRRDAREIRTQPANERGRVGLSEELASFSANGQCN
jgi:hypothetical protein